MSSIRIKIKLRMKKIVFEKIIINYPRCFHFTPNFIHSAHKFYIYYVYTLFTNLFKKKKMLNYV